MPLYKYTDFFKCSDYAAFDSHCEPLRDAPYAGIYACEWCKYEIVAKQDEELPDNHGCNNHSNDWIPTQESGQIHRAKWRLVAAVIQTDVARLHEKP
jgi:hypothetical protein